MNTTTNVIPAIGYRICRHCHRPKREEDYRHNDGYYLACVACREKVNAQKVARESRARRKGWRA